MKKDHRIVGIHITDRIKNAKEIQGVLTDFGCEIKTRLGLHETGSDFCSPEGIMILEFIGDDGKATELKTKLSKVDGIEVKEMLFTH